MRLKENALGLKFLYNGFHFDLHCCYSEVQTSTLMNILLRRMERMVQKESLMTKYYIWISDSCAGGIWFGVIILKTFWAVYNKVKHA